MPTEMDKRANSPVNRTPTDCAVGDHESALLADLANRRARLAQRRRREAWAQALRSTS